MGKSKYTVNPSHRTVQADPGNHKQVVNRMMKSDKVPTIDLSTDKSKMQFLVDVTNGVYKKKNK